MRDNVEPNQKRYNWNRAANSSRIATQRGQYTFIDFFTLPFSHFGHIPMYNMGPTCLKIVALPK